MGCSIGDVPAMDALVEGPVNRYTADINGGIQNGDSAAGNRGRRVAGAGVGLVPFEWVVVGFFVGLFLPSVLLRSLGEEAQVSAGDHCLLLLDCASAYQVSAYIRWSASSVTYDFLADIHFPTLAV